jgi:hypothetical protein
MKKSTGTSMLLGGVCLGLMLSACSNPDSVECFGAVLEYKRAELNASISPASFKLAEVNAIDACGEKGFLQKLADFEAGKP